MGLKQLDHPGEVGKRAAQPVDLVDHHGIDLGALHRVQETPQRGPVDGASGEAPIVEARTNRPPALVTLALDEGLAGLALGIEGVEVLLQPLLRGLAGIDGTAGHGLRAQRTGDRTI